MICACVFVLQETGPDADACAVCIDSYKPGDVLSVLTCKYVCLSFDPFRSLSITVFTINLNFSSLSALNVAIRCVCVCSHFFHKSCIEPWLLEHRTCPMCKCDILKALGVEVSFHTKGGRTPDAKRSAVSRRAMSLKFEHIVFYVCTHTDSVIQRLSAAPSNDSGRCSNSCRATERHLHCFILNNIIFVSNRF